MPLKYYPSYLKTVPSSSQQGFLNDLQQMINQQFDNASDVYTILEEPTPGLPISSWLSQDVRITHVPLTATGDKLGNDWRGLIFKDMTHSYKLGQRYSFDNNYWISVFTDTYRFPTASSTIHRCNSSLKWYDEYHNLINEPAIIDVDLRLTKFLFGSTITLPQGHLKIIMQLNDNTRKIDINQRFVFGKQVFKVDYFNDFIADNTFDVTSAPLLHLTLFKDEVNLAKDDLVLGIADAYSNIYTIAIDQIPFNQVVGFTTTLTSTIKLNGVVVTNQPVTWSSSNPLVGTISSTTGLINLLAIGSVTFTATMTNNSLILASISVTVASAPVVDTFDVRILPLVTKLLQNNTQIYQVALYKNDVQQPDAVVCTASSSIPNTGVYYTFTQDNANQFTVKNLKYYSNSPLVVNCVSGIYSKSITITLGGVY